MNILLWKSKWLCQWSLLPPLLSISQEHTQEFDATTPLLLHEVYISNHSTVRGTFCKFIKELTKICQLFLELFQKWSLAMIACLFAKSWIMWYLCLSLFLGKATLAGGDLALKVQGQQLLLLLRLHHLTFAPPQTFGHLPFSSVLARSTLISSRRTSCHISCS